MKERGRYEKENNGGNVMRHIGCGVFDRLRGHRGGWAYRNYTAVCKSRKTLGHRRLRQELQQGKRAKARTKVNRLRAKRHRR